jgi:hypothetical protein
MARPANRSLAMYAISVPKRCCCLRCSLILEPGTMCLGIEAWHCMQYRCPGGVCLQLRCRRPQRGRRLRRAQPIEAWHCTQMLCPGAAAAYGAARYWSQAFWPSAPLPSPTARPADRSLGLYANTVPKRCCCLRRSQILEPGTVCLELRCRRPWRGQPIEAWRCMQILCPSAAAAYAAARYWSQAPCAFSSAAVAHSASSESKLGNKTSG